MKKYKTLLLWCLPILLVILLTISMTELFYDNMVASTTDSCWAEIQMAHSEASREIGLRLNTNIRMLDLASDAIVTRTDLENEASLLSYLGSVQKETIFDRIDVLFPDATILMQNGERIRYTGRTPWRELLSRKTFLSQRVKDYHTGIESVQVYSSVYDANDAPIAILCATIHCDTLAEVFGSAHYGTDAQLFLVDLRDGSFVLDKWHPTLGSIYDMEPRTVVGEFTVTDYLTDIMQGNSGHVAFISDVDGSVSYMVYAPVADTPYSMEMMIQEELLFAAVDDLKETLTWVGVIELLVLLFFAAWMYIIMRRSLQNEQRARQAELALLKQKDEELQRQYADTVDRREFLEVMAINLPGGYHRCTTDYSFRLTFISNSFTQITGYTMEQVQNELNGSYMGIVLPEDRDYFLSLAPQLERDGSIYCAYRMRRRDGSIRWVQDSTQYVERDGEQYYQCALMDITEQIEEIEQAKQLAEASSMAKSTFLFNISHDIRTPMNAIKGFSHIIEENADNPALVRETIGKLNQAGDSLMMLMNDVLDISRIERGKEEVSLQPMNLNEHGQNLYEMFAADMKAAGIHFARASDELNDTIYCDHLKLTRIMMNMLSNAKKFTPAGGTVTFGVTCLHREEDACTYRFFVRDTGIGMSPDFLKRAFEQFERERTSTESGIAGSGLGLAIIKMLAELMDGTVDIRSEQGKGTEISVTLTFRLASQDQLQQDADSEQNAPDLAGRRILLVEDNDFNREIARYILEDMGLIVEDAVNGAVCLEMLTASPPGCYDLVLMDIQMPVMDGYTAAVEIRKLPDPTRAAVPIVAMTANAFEDDKNKCLEVGMNGHIGKPIDIEALMKVLSDFFR